MYRLGRLLSWLTGLTTVVGGLVIALMMLHVSVDVAARYFFNAPLPGTITIVSYYYMAIAAFVPLAFAEQKDAHISVELVTERLPAFVQTHIARWALLLSAATFWLLAVRSWQEAWKQQAVGASVVQGDLNIPIWLSYFALPLGFGLMAVVVSYKFLVVLTGARSGLYSARAATDTDEQALEGRP